MKRFWPLLLLVVIPYQSTLAQEVKQAPTVERCRADQRLWLSKLETKSGYVSAPFTELNGWFSEMLACEKVDPASAHRYHNTRAKILAEQALRLQGFLYKHNLYDKFIAEDAQGR